MDSKHKSLLMQHKPFLIKNIIWSPQFSHHMKAQGLLTQFMIDDIETCESREDKIRKMLDVLPLRGTSSWNKFLDVLLSSGHVFIADFLSEDEDSQKVFDTKDMYKALPFVKRAFNETEKKQIEQYMAEKIESHVLKMLWQRDTREKDKALEARQKQIEQAYEYEEQFKEKANAINALEIEINASMEDKEKLKANLAALSAAHIEMQQKHKEAMAVQMRYNQANDNAIQRANERVAAQEKCIRSIKERLDSCAKVDSRRALGKVTFDDLEDEDVDKKDMKKARDEFLYILEDVDLFIRKFNKLIEVRKEYEKLLEERDYILIHFGFQNDEENKKTGGMSNNNNNNQEPSLVTAYKNFAVRNEENIMQMKKEIEKYDGLLEDHKTKLEEVSKQKEEKKKFALGASTWQNAIMGVMRKQLQDVKADVRKKETLMGMQEEEVTKLKHRIAELEKQLRRRDHDSATLNLKDDADAARLVTPDSVELIPTDTPKLVPGKVRNLPPLKYSQPPVAKSASNHHHHLIKSRPNPGVVAQSKNLLSDSSQHPIIQYPMGPITTQMKPEARTMSKPISQMGHVLGDLKAMNKHFNRGSFLVDESRSGLRRSNTSINKQA